MNSHYLIAVIMSAIASSMTLILVLSFLKTTSSLNETLNRYYGTQNSEIDTKPFEKFSQSIGENILKQVYGYLNKLKLYDSSIQADLDLVNKNIKEISYQIAKNSIMSFGVSVLIYILIQFFKINFNQELLLLLAFVVIVGLSILPILELKSEAKKERENSLIIISAYLDLVSLCLSGGMGLEESLTVNTNIGRSVLMSKLSNQFALSNQLNLPLWMAFNNVAEDLNLPILKEIGSIFKISGTEGAKIRNSISRKAQSLREKRLIKEEADANSVTERLFLPSVLLLLGFLVFVGYPAVEKIFTGL